MLPQIGTIAYVAYFITMPHSLNPPEKGGGGGVEHFVLKGRGVGEKNQRLRGSNAYQATNFLQRPQVLKSGNFMISKYFIIFIVYVDLHWYAYYVNVSVSVK